MTEIEKRLLDFQAAAIEHHDVCQNYTASEQDIADLIRAQQHESRTYQGVLALIQESQ